MSAAPVPENAAAVTPVTPETARRVAAAWVDAWNAHDLERILSHYADDVVFTSPVAVRRMNLPDGTVRGKGQLRAYFGQGLRAQPQIRFDLEDVLVGVDSVALVYRNQRGQRVVEVMHLNMRGQVYRAVVQYAG
jgi:ketosteroid isomerase-like protein